MLKMIIICFMVIYFCTKLLPRVVLEAFPKDLLGKKKQKNKAIDLIVAECK